MNPTPDRHRDFLEAPLISPLPGFANVGAPQTRFWRFVWDFDFQSYIRVPT
jgi:hypothetical protein